MIEDIDKPLPEAWICDIDGTVALHGPDTNPRGHYEWDKVADDHPNWPVIEIVGSLLRHGQTIIFLSGREDACYFDTENWLDPYFRNLGRFRHLVLGPFMRKTGDRRPDYIVKRELYDLHIEGKYNIKGVFDDRTQVVNMWRNDLNLTCLQVCQNDE